MDGSYADQENPNDVLYLNYNNKKQLLDENGKNIFRLTEINQPSEQYVFLSSNDWIVWRGINKDFFVKKITTQFLIIL